MNPHELKELQVRLTKAQAEAETAQGELGRAQQKYRDAVQLVEQLRSRLTNASQKPVVSEHALLRYIERFHRAQRRGYREARYGEVPDRRRRTCRRQREHRCICR
jgi:chromosome segregation ATPase